MKNNELFAHAFTKLCLTFDDRRNRPEVFDVWEDALSKYDGNEIDAAIDTLCRTFTPVSYKPFPVPADLIQIIAEQREAARRVIFRACDVPPGDPPPPDWEKRLEELKKQCAAKMQPDWLMKDSSNAKIEH